MQTLAPHSGPVIGIAPDAMEVTMAFGALDAAEAVRMDSGVAGTIFGGVTRVQAEPT